MELNRNYLSSGGKKPATSTLNNFDNYAAVFKNRDYYLSHQATDARLVKRDDNMAAAIVGNVYDYAVIKIQKWWRRKQFKQKVMFYTSRGGKFTNQARLDDQQFSSHLAQIQLQLTLLRDTHKQAARVDKDLDQDWETLLREKITSIQGYWRARLQRRALRMKLKDRTNEVYRVVHEVQARDGSLNPSNYTIRVRRVKEQPHSFEITSVLNNGADPQEQVKMWNAEQTPEELGLY